MGRLLVARRPELGLAATSPSPADRSTAEGDRTRHQAEGVQSSHARPNWERPSCGCSHSRVDSTDGVGGNSCDAQRREALARGGDRAVDVDAAASILDHDHGKALAARVLGRVAYAEIEREPRHEDSRQAPLAQIAGKAGGGLAIVLVEGGVGIDRGPEALAQNELGVRNLQTVVELRTGRVLNAMIRPQDLLSVVDRDGLEWTFVAMRRCERVVAGRMPILRQHHMPETRGDAIDDRHDFMAARNGEFATWTEVILDIDDQQDVAVADRDRVGHRFAFCACAMRPSTSAASRRSASLTSTG